MAVSGTTGVVGVERVPVRMLPGVTTWGVDAVGAPLLWDVDGNGALDPGAAAGAGVVVCIIDTGVTRNHPDLAAVTFIGGYPDAPWDPSIDWRSDTNGHGTHVAGTIAAQLDGAGVVGVAPRAALFIVRLPDPFFSSDVIDGITRCQTAGADVIHLSLGGPGYSVTEEAAYGEFYASGLLLVASSGNDASSSVSFPAGYDSVVSVGAANSDGRRPGFSNADPFVELAAPGVDVLSAAPITRTSRIEVGGETYTLQMLPGTPPGTATGPLVDGGRCAPVALYNASSLSFPGAIVICRYDFTTVGWRGWVGWLQGSGVLGQIVLTGLDHTGDIGPNDFGSEVDGLTGLATTNAGIDLLTRHVGKTATLTNVEDLGTPGLAVLSGTSMAAPHAAGVAALVWSHFPARTNAEIRNALTASARNLRPEPLPRLRTDDFGHGLVQAQAAVEYLDSL